jgi:hypothetical protein
MRLWQNQRKRISETTTALYGVKNNHIDNVLITVQSIYNKLFF